MLNCRNTSPRVAAQPPPIVHLCCGPHALSLDAQRGGQTIMKQSEPGDASAQGQRFASASLFGRFQLRAADGTEIVISNSRARALLAMLCLASVKRLIATF